jgi:carbonic anhydrase/acetyltransferase-like protein (isoleucine patch superfamily)
MLIEHGGKKPQVDPSACAAPTAVVCAVVRVGADARIRFGDRAVVTENASRQVAEFRRESCGDLPG